MDSSSTLLLSDLPKYKRNISFFEKESRQVCTGINLEATCTNPSCECVLNFRGLVVVKYPGVTSCVYQEVVPHLRCPSCRSELQPEEVKGVVFVRCEAKISKGVESVEFRVRGDDTTLWELPYQGADVLINILDREPEPKSESKEFLSPGDGVNLSAVCRNNKCQASITNNGWVIIRVGRVESTTYKELLNNRSCPSCKHPLEPRCFHGVIFNTCQGEVEIADNVQRFNAHQMPKLCKIDLTDHVAVIRIRQTITDIHSTPNSSPETVISEQEKASNPQKAEVSSVHDQFLEGVMGKHLLMHSFLPAKGLNLLARCSNTSCPSQSQPQMEGIVNLNIGEVTDCRLKQLIQGKTCPCCHHALPPASFMSTTFTQCTARVKTADYVISYLFGQSVESVPIGISKDPVVDILPLQTKFIFMEPYGSPYKQMKRGMNLKVICSNLDCTSKKSTDGIIIISLQEMKLYTLNDLFSTVKCPSCNNKLSHMILLTLSFMHCRAELLVGKDRFVIESWIWEVIDFKPDSSAGIKIHVMEEEGNTSVLFPNDPIEGSISKGAKFSHSSICHGLNFTVECLNPTCEAVKRSEYVMIQSGHIIDCDLRTAMQSLNCSSCDARIAPHQVNDATFLCCSGEITVRGKKDKFNPTGHTTADFNIPNDNSPVIVKVYHREYHIVYNPALGFLDTPYTKHHNGINFHCYCKNLSCTAVQIENGVVIVQRDDFMVHQHGYSLSTCYYSQEISQLSCTSCGSHLRKYYVWGVGLLHCRGTITRNGSPVEHFSPSIGQVAQYELDTGDTSLKIEFQLVES